MISLRAAQQKHHNNEEVFEVLALHIVSLHCVNDAKNENERAKCF